MPFHIPTPETLDTHTYIHTGGARGFGAGGFLDPKPSTLNPKPQKLLWNPLLTLKPKP